MDWFTVDRIGLAQLIERRGAATAVLELVQNAWDTDATLVEVSLHPIGRARARLEVCDDDPGGFETLAHAFTLFTPSTKKDNAEKRGRFNLGEKLVLALCERATIASTTGTVEFDHSGRTVYPRRRRCRGSVFSATIRLTKSDIAEVDRLMHTLLVPDRIQVTYNQQRLSIRPSERTFMLSLPTEIADAEGVLRRTKRKTLVRLVQPVGDEIPHLYELGIPVVEIDVPWHVDVGQKVPLNFERDNVTPAYISAIHKAVLEQTWDRLQEDEAAAPWVSDALASPGIASDAVKGVVLARFGRKAVIYDRTDLEANNRAVNQGYTVIQRGTFNKAQWNNIEHSGAVQPAGEVTPSPRIDSDPDGIPPIPESAWNPSQRRIAAYAKAFARELIDRDIMVRLQQQLLGQRALAWYGNDTLTLHVSRLGSAWFERPSQHRVDELLLHELAHQYESNHLSAEFHDVLCRLGAKARDVTVRLEDFS